MFLCVLQSKCYTYPTEYVHWTDKIINRSFKEFSNVPTNFNEKKKKNHGEINQKGQFNVVQWIILLMKILFKCLKKKPQRKL